MSPFRSHRIGPPGTYNLLPLSSTFLHLDTSFVHDIIQYLTQLTTISNSTTQMHKNKQMHNCVLNYVNSCSQETIHIQLRYIKEELLTESMYKRWQNNRTINSYSRILKFRVLAHLSFTRRRNLSDQPLRRSVGREEREVGTYRDGRVKRVLPTRDQHRREIASNLWVRLITGECSSFDSPLFLRPQLHQTSFQRRGEPPLLSRHLFHSLSLSSKFVRPSCTPSPLTNVYALELAY